MKLKPFSFYQLLFSPPLQDSLNGLPDFALSSLLCLGLAVLTLWVLAYALHSVSWNSGDHLARRFRTIFGSVTAKIEMQSASLSTVLAMSGLTAGQAYMKFICLCVFCAFAFLMYLIIFPKWLKFFFWPCASLILFYVAVPSTNFQEVLVLHRNLSRFLSDTVVQCSEGCRCWKMCPHNQHLHSLALICLFL